MAPPTNQPFSPPFLPAMNPPINKARKEIPNVTTVKSDSASDVKVNKSDMTRLANKIIPNIHTRPEIMAEKAVRENNALPHFNPYFNFITAYSDADKIDQNMIFSTRTYDVRTTFLERLRNNTFASKSSADVLCAISRGYCCRFEHEKD